MLKLFLKTILLTLAFLLVLLMITAAGAGWYAYQQLHQFTQAAEVNLSEVKQTLAAGWTESVSETNGYKNILILGIDSLATRGEAPPLTDTIMLVSLNLKNGQVKLVSLPRDLWLANYQTKINTLLAYGPARYPDQPEQFPQEAISELTGVTIHHTVILNMAEVSGLIDLVGGVEVEVTAGFIDDQFPRPDVDIKTEHDPAKLYQTVEFVPGVERMNGQRALQFIRSRHSDGDQGTDLARSTRQQQVILALLKKLQTPEVITNPAVLGQLYRFYLHNFNRYLPLTQLVATLKTLLPIRNQLLANLNIQTQGLTIAPDDQDGVLTHPQTNMQKYQNQWVYIIQDEVKFKQEIKFKLNP